eukprot:8714670-Prorocentrum_lima.AAC.1
MTALTGIGNAAPVPAGTEHGTPGVKGATYTLAQQAGPGNTFPHIVNDFCKAGWCTRRRRLPD